jgi:hypothetical protein
MNLDVAERISTLMLQISAHLDQSIALIRDTGTVEEFEAYRRAVGMLMGSILLDIEEPIFKEHPSLRPDYLDGPRKIDLKIFEPAFYEYGSDPGR